MAVEAVESILKMVILINKYFTSHPDQHLHVSVLGIKCHSA